MKKTLLALAAIIASCFIAQYANATLTDGSALSFIPISTGGSVADLPADGLGSWFAMEVSPGTHTITPVSSLNGIVIGTTQPASSVGPDENIDEAWNFFGNTGVHLTTSLVWVLTDNNAGNVTLDFSGWGVSWNSIPFIPLGETPNTGIASLVCDIDCSVGDSYILNYTAVVPSDLSSKGGVIYNLHLEGTISSIPVPAAIWLFGSGLLGLVGFSRYQKYL